jgi:hypothetical protein
LAQKPIYGSHYTDLSSDCVEVEMATDKAEIDFYTLECSAVGGYKLEISGGDLRYSPTLYWNEKAIEIDKPLSFHQPGSTKVEWIYRLVKSEEGTGSLRWIGFIYRLDLDENGVSKSVLYAMRLDKSRSCLIGEIPASPEANVQARELVYKSKPDCR